MRNRVYWGLGVLIVLFIGVSVFLLTRTTETEPEIIYKLPTPEEMKEVERNIQDAIDKAKKNQPPKEMPNKNSQQNGSVELVLVENYLEGLTDIDLFGAITLPTNAQLANYTDEDIKELYRVIHEATKNEHAIWEKLRQQNEAIKQAKIAIDPRLDPLNIPRYLNGDFDGFKLSKSDQAKLSQLSKQNLELSRIDADLDEQRKKWREETARIRENTQHYGRGF